MSKRRYMSNQGQGCPKKNSDIKIKLKIIWPFITNFCMFCAYSIEAQISGERLQDHWSSGLSYYCSKSKIVGTD